MQVIYLHSLQQGFINAISASLIRAPDFKDSTDAALTDFICMADAVCAYDAEFVLKVEHIALV
jgi:hypothetical protein